MQKQTNFFEQNVQWFALAVGGLFLAWMLYAYVLTDPGTINVGMHKAVAPGEVDKLTLDGPVNDLKRDIARSDVPDIPQKDYVQNFLAAINGSKEKPVQLARLQIRSAPMNPPGTVLAVGPNGIPQNNGPDKPVTELPIQPAAHVGSHTEGRSQVTYDDPKWQPNPNKPSEQPPQITADKDWWSGEFIIDGAELYKAFAKAFDVKKIEAVYPTAEPFFQTALVDVELVRQEIGAGNKVVKEEVVKPLDNQPPTIRPPYPKPDADQQTFSDYLNTVTKNPIELQSPPFYQVIAGDPWMEPGEATDTLLVQMKQANKEQRKQQKEQLRQQQLQKVQAAQAARNARAGAAAGGAPDDLAAAEEAAMDPVLRGGSGAVRGRTPYPAPPPPALSPSGLPVGRRPVAGVAGRPGARAVVPINPMVLGAGKFAVTDGMGPIRIIAHDDTVQPGKTYRYKLRYKLFNPLYMGTAAAPELTRQFALKGPDSQWTGTFTIRPKVEFFLASTTRDKATFDLFQFKDGMMRKSSTSVSAGDMIQSANASTGVSLVDTGGTGDKAYALLMDENGQVVRREPKADKESDRYDELNFEATQPPTVGLNQ